LDKTNLLLVDGVVVKHGGFRGSEVQTVDISAERTRAPLNKLSNGSHKISVEMRGRQCDSLFFVMF
jgi:hypothetical protein